MSTVSGTTAIYSIVYNSPGFGSATRLIGILLHGDDYKRSLSGATFGSHTRLADRLSNIEAAVTLDAMYAQSGISGTQWSYRAGQVRNNNVINSAAASYISMGASAIYRVEVDPSTGTVSYLSGGTGFTSGSIPLRYLVTSGGVIISNEDRRTWAVAAGSGAGGASVSGTPETTWTLNIDFTSGSPSSNASLRVARGSLTGVDIRWNEASDQWEFTNDGTSYVAIGSLQSLNIGAQQQSRFTMVISAPMVLNEENRNPSSGLVVSLLSLSAYVSTTTFAVILRGWMTDSNPGSSLSAGSVAGISFYRDSATITAAAEAVKVPAVSVSRPEYYTIIVPVSNQYCEYQVEGSSDGSATVKFALIGYYDYVTGAGTQRLSGTQTGLGVAASTGSNTTLTSPGFAAAMRRGLVYYLETSGSMGSGSLYDVEFYKSASGAASQVVSHLLFQAKNIDASAAYITRLPWYYEDSNSNTQVHLRISNNGMVSGAFSVLMVAEQYA
ncbi:MAG TPA: hypothetical protein VNP04_13650 [Alphaproteobacteria bacterium]|nr:hypothetical protein [Alphaproteobacteria bacterium]